jgi:hypothetical protein
VFVPSDGVIIKDFYKCSVSLRSYFPKFNFTTQWNGICQIMTSGWAPVLQKILPILGNLVVNSDWLVVGELIRHDA